MWGNLKNIIKRIYYSIQNKNFVLFLKEAEFRREISGLANNIKWQNFVDIMNYINNIEVKNLYSLDYLNKFTVK